MADFEKAVDLPAWWSRDLEAIKIQLEKALAKLQMPMSEKKTIAAALRFAEFHHKGKNRAGGEEYIVHPYRVFLSLFYEFEEKETYLFIAALLHDLLEDTKVDAKDIKHKFGVKVLNLVKKLTRSEEEDRTEEGDSINNTYFQRIKRNPPNAILLKVADKLDNIRDALNHPKVRKRNLYVKECQTVFIPLLHYLKRPALISKLQLLLERAMKNHQFYIDRITLFNPTLKNWYTRDSVQIVPTDPPPLMLAQNVATSIINKIDSNDVEILLQIAEAPRFLGERDKIVLWQRVRSQLIILNGLLNNKIKSDWLEPVLGSQLHLLSVIHSRLLLPANWLFPPWQKDYAVCLLKSKRELYNKLSDETTCNKWLNNLTVLLSHREAFFRWNIGHGGNSAQSILSILNNAAKKGSWDVLVSMRLLGEYLDVMTNPEYVNENKMKAISSIWNKALTNKQQLLLEHPVEIAGLSSVQNAFPRRPREISLLSDIAVGVARKKPFEAHKSAWVNFNSLEIIKRSTFFDNALKKIGKKTDKSSLSKIGISLSSQTIDQVVIVTIEPEKWDALKDRLPEITTRERIEIHKNDYSSIALFDTLLAANLGPKSGNLWLPRVYRILDTMQDFDPHNIQSIIVSFQAEEKIEDISVYLPIPRLNNVNEIKLHFEAQLHRKTIIARYIVTIIYNHVVTFGIYSATVDCQPVAEPFAALSFTNKELEPLLKDISRKYNFEEQYGKYIETYNFRKFSVKTALRTGLQIDFTGKDIVNGTYLGIDIGGTDTKVCMFEKGEVLFNKQPVFSFPTIEYLGFSGHISVQQFCIRMIEKIEEHFFAVLNVKKFPWQRLNGIGISWPGAVKDSKIAAFSKTLEKLSFESGGDRVTIQPKSPANEIHSIDLCEALRNELLMKCPSLPDSFVVVIENDGNAEAYGNYCVLAKSGDSLSGGKLILKLGTSIAGGHINSHGAVSPHVTEFSKVILDFNTREGGKEIQGPARQFLPSYGVRRLSRVFSFNGKPVIGKLISPEYQIPLNDSDERDTRVEAVETGKLLSFFYLIDDESLRINFLNDLIKTDNLNAPATYQKTVNVLSSLLPVSKSMQSDFKTYIHDRGIEEIKRALNRKIDIDKGNSCIWNLGLARTYLLLNIPVPRIKMRENALPDDFPYDTMAQTILGCVALYSQLGLLVAHMAATLYNIYKKDRFNEIILSGGILRGTTGKLVISQAEKFLAKYYDKIFGPTKHLKPGSLRQAVQVKNPDTVGPFGAAMVANRVNKVNTIAMIAKKIDSMVSAMNGGEILTREMIMREVSGMGTGQKEVEKYLDNLISRSVLIRRNRNGKEFIKGIVI